MTLVLYREVKHELEGMTIPQIHTYLYYRQTVTGDTDELNVRQNI